MGRTGGVKLNEYDQQDWRKGLMGAISEMHEREEYKVSDVLS